jgi:D-alanyl-D-alanine carboxypeptidase (penicillin-binding protein 5/6)
MSDGLSELSELMRDERVPEREPIEPQVLRRRRRRRLLVGGIVTAVVLGLAATYAGYTLTAPVGAADATSRVPDVSAPEAATIEMSPEGASAISISGGEDYLGPDADGIWMTAGGDDPRPIASISKLITALVVLDAKPLASADDDGPTITFSKGDHALYDKY